MRRTLVLLATALVTGCAGPGGGAGTLPQGPLPSPAPSVGGSPAPQPRGTGTVTVQLTPGTLTGASFSFAGYDSAGRTIYGPLARDRSDSIVIPDVPVNAATLGIAVLTGNTTIGVGQAPLTLATTVTQTIRDPEVQPLTTLVGLDLQPQALKIAFGTAGQLTATGRFNNGRSVLMSAAVNWLSLDQFIVPVTPTGEAEGAGEGGVTVIASAGVVNATARVQVTGVRLEAINIVPPTVRLSSLANTTLTATGSFSDGTTQDLTTLVQWTSKRPEVASVSPSGLVVGLSEGETTIEAVGGPVTAVARAVVGR